MHQSLISACVLCAVTYRDTGSMATSTSCSRITSLTPKAVAHLAIVPMLCRFDTEWVMTKEAAFPSQQGEGPLMLASSVLDTEDGGSSDAIVFARSPIDRTLTIEAASRRGNGAEGAGG